MGHFSRLYHGDTHVDFIGRTKLWFTISGIAILIGLASLFTRQLNLGIDFEGGAVWEVPANGVSVETARSALEGAGVADPKVQTLSSDEGVRLRVQSESLGVEREQQIAEQLAELTGADRSEVNLNSVGPSWGEEISRKAIRALAIFLIVITLYITFRFELKMALPTLAALVHDVLITLGVYSLTGFEVTPATVIAVLTILGYSIYDGIVVFDKVDENTRLVSSTNRITYSDMVNLSLNQTLMRSLNTTLTAVLPILSLLVVGSLILGATTLQEFAVALLIGLASGAYSSIFIASPMLAVLKEREPRYRDVRRRIDARAGSSKPPIEPVAGDDADDVVDRAPQPRATLTSTVPRPTGAIPPRPRKKGKRR